MRKLKYPVQRAIRLKESTDKRLLADAIARDVHPAVRLRQLIEGYYDIADANDRMIEE